MSAENSNVDTKSQTTHVVAKVERTVSAAGETRGAALAAFVQLPSESDPTSSFLLAGLDLTRPDTGVCTENVDVLDELVELPTAELLEADGVQLITSDGVHALAPHAFPGVYDLLRGVVYASRDQSGAELPAAGEYQLEGAPLSEGGDDGGRMLVTARHQSPPFPEALSINGVDWNENDALPPAKVADFSWTPSDRTDDIITVKISDEQHSYTCAFADADGYGAVPLTTPSGDAVALEGSSVRIEVHRLRSTYETAQNTSYQVKLNFDFATEKVWLFSESSAETSSEELALEE